MVSKSITSALGDLETPASATWTAECRDFISELSTEAGSEASEVDQPQDSESLLIFDWDDTMFPTTWLRRQGDSFVNREGLRLLAALEQKVYTTLALALELGRVVIVTNAEHGWVEFSSARFFPSLVPLLSEVNIISARAHYEHHDAACPAVWKCLAFVHEMETTFAGSRSARLNVVSFGDSIHEQAALAYATQGVARCQAKFIKFLELPEIENLIEEHDVVHASMHDIVEYCGNMDFEISPEGK